MIDFDTLNETDYDNLRFTFIRNVEQYKGSVYDDGLGISTIGLGFNLQDSASLTAVLNELTGNDIPTGLQSAITDVVSSDFTSGSGGTIDQLNAVLGDYSISGTFTLTLAQSKDIFENLLATSHEDTLTAKIASIPDSEERVALFSLAYDSPSLIGSNLIADINNGDRAEAWYEIRYGSNGNDLDGLAKRRYYESDTFSLYKDRNHVTDKEALDVYRMTERHSGNISSYDATYGKMINTNVDIHGNPVNANHDYDTSILQDGKVDTTAEDVAPAHDYLVSTYAHGVSIDNIWVDYAANPSDTDPTHQINTYSGTAGNDLIFGGVGDDTLNGGAGQDVIYGGDGTNTFIYNVAANSTLTSNELYYGGANADTLHIDLTTANLTDAIRDEILNVYKTDVLTTPSGGFNYDFTHLHVSLHDFENLAVTLDGHTVDLATSAKNDEFMLAENGSVSGNLFSDNGSGADYTFGSALSATAGTFTTDHGGSITISTDGTLSFAALSSYTGVDSYTYTVTDTAGTTSTATASFDVQEVHTGSSSNDILSYHTTTHPVYVSTGGGNDIVGGSAFGDYIDGGTGDDNLNGDLGNDNILGGDGNDTIFGSLGSDTLHGGNGTDTLWASGNGGTPDASTDTNYLYGDGGNDLLNGSDGTDFMYGGDGDDYFYPSHGNDYIDGGTGSDTVDLSAYLTESGVVDISGASVQFHNSSGDTVTITNVEGFAFGTYGETVQGSSNTDYIYNQGGTNIVHGAGGDDFIYGGLDNDSLYGDSGNDTVNGSYGNDTLDGGAGNDTVDGGNDNDILIYNYGENVGATDVYKGGAGSDTLELHISSSDLSAALNADIAGFVAYLANPSHIDTSSSSGATYTFSTFGLSADRFEVFKLIVDGSEKNIVSSSGSISGTSGDDYIIASSGNDTITNGAGNDTVFSGSGNDVFSFTLADYAGGTDKYYGGSGSDRLDLYITTTDFSQSLNNDIGGFADFIADSGNINTSADTGAEYHFSSFDLTAGRIEDFHLYVNGTQQNIVHGSGTFSGTSGNDYVIGGTGNDVINAGSGNDYVFANSGNDTLTYTYEDNSSNSDVYYGGTGTDTLNLVINHSYDVTDALNADIVGFAAFLADTGHINTSAVTGAEYDFSNIDLTANAFEALNLTVEGTAVNIIVGSGTITGSTANDYIIGSAGNDTITNSSTGNNFVFGGTGNDTITVSGSSGVNTVYGGAGDDVFVYNLAANTGTTDHYFGNAGSDRLDMYITSGAITSALASDIAGFQSYLADSGHINTSTDTGAEYDFSSIGLTASRFEDFNLYIDGSLFTHLISGSGSISDTSSNDYIVGSSGSDTITSTSGDDSIYAGGGDDFITAGSGTNTIYAGDGNDVIHDGSGTDSIDGGAGSNTIYFVDNTMDETGASLNLTATSNNAVDSFGHTETIINVETIIGTSYNDTFTAADMAVSINGSDGDDTITYTSSASVTDETSLIGYTGNNTLNLHVTGAELNDTIREQLAHYAQDVEIGGTYNPAAIFDISGLHLSMDVFENFNLYVDNVATPINVTAKDDDFTGLMNHGQSGNVLDDNGHGADTGFAHDLSIVANHLTSVNGSTLDLYSDGSFSYNPTHNFSGTDTFDYTLQDAWGHTDTGHIAFDMTPILGTSGADSLYTTSTDDTVYAYAGDDTIYGSAGNDTIDGGDGHNVVDYSSVMTSPYGFLEVDLTASTVTAFKEFVGTDHLTHIDGIIAGAGSDYLNGDAHDNYFDGRGGDDYLYGNDGNDTIYGGDGNDTVDGGSGDNYLYGDDGDNNIYALDGNNTIYANDGDNTVTVGDGNNIIHLGDGTNSITVGAGNNEIHAGIGNNTITTGDGDNTIYTHDGNDNITVGIGNNLIHSGAGDDIVYGGHGIVYGGAGDDDIELGDGGNTIHGGSGDDYISSGAGDDVLDGGSGSNYIIGGAGADTFVFTAHSMDGNLTTIADFSPSGDNDVLNLKDLLTGYTPGTSDINDYVHLATSGSNTTLSIDTAGTGSAYQDVATLQGITGLSVDDLFNNSHLTVTS